MLNARFSAFAFGILFVTSAAAQETARVAVAPSSKLTIEGTSNLHGWACRTQTLEAVVELDAAAVVQVTTAPPKALKRVEVKVPVKSLKCGNGTMDGNLYKALKANETPEISYILATFDAVADEPKNAFSLKTEGRLTVAGTERPLSMEVIATRLADGTVKATGTVPIKMTDFGIKPPTAIFGRLKTGDEVKVSFELTIAGKALAAAANP